MELRVIRVSSSQDNIYRGIIGGYSHFKRLRLKPPFATEPFTQRRSVPVLFRILCFRKENNQVRVKFYFFKLFREIGFVQPSGSSV